MKQLSKIMLGLLLIVTAHLSWGDAQKDTITTPASLASLALSDQHGVAHVLGNNVNRIYYTRDMTGGKLMKKVFGEHGQTVIDGEKTIAISNVSAMNSFIRKHMALPALEKRPYAIWIDDSGITNDLPYQENQVTILDITNRSITKIRFVSKESNLREIAELPVEK